MRIYYNLSDDKHSYDIKEDNKTSLALSNYNGDFLVNGIDSSVDQTSKFHGYFVKNTKDNRVYKVLDKINVETKTNEVEYGGYYFILRSKNQRESKNGLTYNKNKGTWEKTERVESSVEKYYMGPEGGLIYTINGYNGKISLDLDIRELSNFNEWGRLYKIYKERSNVWVVEFRREEDKEHLFMVVAIEGDIEFRRSSKWEEKFYSYSKERNSLYRWYVFRGLRGKVNGSGTLYIGVGSSKREALSKAVLMKNGGEKLEGFDKKFLDDICESNDFKYPISVDRKLAYKSSLNSLYKFLNRSILKESDVNGCYAGLMWFSQVWSRDDLIALKAFIDQKEYNIVKRRIFEYLDMIDENGTLPIILEGDLNREDNRSTSSTFWLSQRILDFILDLSNRGDLEKVISKSELVYIFDKLDKAFHNLSAKYWDWDVELLKVNPNDSWMDTRNTNFPLDVEVGYLKFCSVLATMASMMGKEERTKHYLDFEQMLLDKIRAVYYKNNKLYEDIESNKRGSTLFLVYYIYPNLFTKKEWEILIDKSLNDLLTEWGGLRTLSFRIHDYQKEYTGENNISYHNGDCWFWISNIAAKVLNELNEKKYRDEIRRLLSASTKDILKTGVLGYGSELSSAKERRAEGNLAQLWSSSTYIEVINSILKKL